MNAGTRADLASAPDTKYYGRAVPPVLQSPECRFRGSHLRRTGPSNLYRLYKTTVYPLPAARGCEQYSVPRVATGCCACRPPNDRCTSGRGAWPAQVAPVTCPVAAGIGSPVVQKYRDWLQSSHYIPGTFPFVLFC